MAAVASHSDDPAVHYTLPLCSDQRNIYFEVPGICGPLFRLLKGLAQVLLSIAPCACCTCSNVFLSVLVAVVVVVEVEAGVIVVIVVVMWQYY